MLAIFLCIYSATALALDDEVHQLVGASELRSPNVQQMPVEFYNRDDMGTEKILTINPLHIENVQEQKQNLVASVQNTDDLNVRPRSVPQTVNMKLGFDNEANKLQHLQTVVKDCLERHSTMHAYEDNPKATNFAQYTSYCPYTLNAIDLLKILYHNFDLHSKMTSDNLDILSNINQVSSHILNNCHHPIINNHQMPKYLEHLLLNRHNLHVPSLVGPYQNEAKIDITNLRGNNQKSVINQFTNSQNMYTTGYIKNNNQGPSYLNNNLMNLWNRPDINVLPETNMSPNSNILSLLNTISSLKQQPGDYRSQIYAKILSDKLNNILNKHKDNNYNGRLLRPSLLYPNLNNIKEYYSSVQGNSGIGYTRDTLGSTNSNVKINQFPDIFEIDRNTKDGINLNNPTAINNVANSNIKVNQHHLNLHDKFKVVEKSEARSSAQNLHNTYGLYQQSLYPNTLGSNPVNPELQNIISLQRNPYVTSNNIHIGADNYRESMDFSRLLGIANSVKLNYVPNNRGVIELTYVIKQAKPTYQPLYYIKYRLPSQKFYANMQNILTQKLHLRSSGQDLHEELLAGSNVTEVPVDLKGLNNDEIIKLVSDKGSLVTARVLENNEATADEQLRIIKDMNSKLSLVNSDNSNGSDKQHLEAVERLINATRSNVLGSYSTSYTNPMSMVDFQRASSGYNIVSPYSRPYSNSLANPTVQISSNYINNLNKPNPLYPTIYG